MINRNKKWSIAITIGVGTLSFAAYAGKVPEELREAIRDSVIVTCTLIQTRDKKEQPPDGSADRKKLT